MKQRQYMGFGLAHLALCLLLAGKAGAQVVNPGFETAGTSATNAASWTADTLAGGPVYGMRTNDNPHSGSYNFEVHLASIGAGPVVQFNQSAVPVTGGTTNAFVFYADALAGSTGENSQWRILWNAGGDTGYLPFTPGNNAYAYISNSVVAPAGATSATIFFHFGGAASLTQTATIDVDDVSLSTTNVVSGGGGGGGTATNTFKINIVPGTGISWYASNNVAYQVQWASNSVSPNWNNLGNQITGNGSTNTLFDVVGAPHNFYQVLSIQ